MYYSVYYRSAKYYKWIELLIVSTPAETSSSDLVTLLTDNYVILHRGEFFVQETTDIAHADRIYEYTELVKEAEYAEELRIKIVELNETTSTIQKLRMKKRQLESGIEHYDRILTNNGKITNKFFLKKGKISEISDELSLEKGLPERIEPIRCRFCTDIVEHKDAHYFPGAYDPWICYQWNHP